VRVGGDLDLARLGLDLQHVAELDVEHVRRLEAELRVAAPHGLGDRVRHLVQSLHAREPAVVEVVRRVHDEHRVAGVAYQRRGLEVERGGAGGE
jgi:hypothetical protein